MNSQQSTSAQGLMSRETHYPAVILSKAMVSLLVDSSEHKTTKDTKRHNNQQLLQKTLWKSFSGLLTIFLTTILSSNVT